MVVGAAVLALLFVLAGIGGGTGWGDDRVEDSDAETQPAMPTESTAAEPSSTSAVGPSGATTDTGEGDAQVSGSLVDHVSGCIARVRDGIERADFGSAAAALEEAATWELNESLARRLERSRAQFRRVVRDRALDGFAAATAGAVLDAVDALRPVVGLPAPMVVEAYDAGRTESGWPRLRRVIVAGDVPSVGVLRRGSSVRCAIGDSVYTGVVSGVDEDGVTVEVAQDGTLSWPIVPRHLVVPRELTADAWFDQCAAAILAEDGLLAALCFELGARMASSAEHARRRESLAARLTLPD